LSSVLIGTNVAPRRFRPEEREQQLGAVAGKHEHAIAGYDTEPPEAFRDGRALLVKVAERELLIALEAEELLAAVSLGLRRDRVHERPPVLGKIEHRFAPHAPSQARSLCPTATMAAAGSPSGGTP